MITEIGVQSKIFFDYEEEEEEKEEKEEKTRLIFY